MNLNTEMEELLRTPLCYMSEDELEDAFSLVTTILEICPGEKCKLKSILEGILATWGRLLERSGHYDKMFSCYHKALTVFCDHEGIISNLGAHLLRAGYLEKASEYFQEALQIKNSYLPAQRNLETVHSFLVERWHFRMLNDNIRNNSFREAIMKKVKKGFNRVLDIGTGTGILSLFAIEGGAQEIYACDNSETMVKISSQVFNRNRATEKVKLIHKLSNDLKIPDDIPQRVSLVITETLDIGLLGENILQTLIHAWDNLLLPYSEDENTSCSSSVKTGCVIPHSADVWVAAVECSHIGMKYRVLTTCDSQNVSRNLQNSEHICGFDCREFFKLNLFASDGCEYDSMDLSNIPKGYRFLTLPAKGMSVNFNDRLGMERLLKGTAGNHEISVLCTGEGSVDAIVLWFDLKLDEDIELSSTPMDAVNRAKCWDQAIFPLQIPIHVTKNKCLKLKVGCQKGKMSVKLSPFNKLNNIIQDTYSESNLSPRHGDSFFCTNYLSDTIEGLKSFPASKDMISFLNDKCWMDSLNELFQLFEQTDVFENFTDILDLSPFPVFGLAFLINNLRSGKCHITLTCVANEEQDIRTITSIAKANNVSDNHLQIMHGELDGILSPTPKFDLVLALPVEVTGKLHEKNIIYLPFFNLIKKSNGIFMPKEIKVCFQLIYSQWLEEVSCVQGNERVCGHDIAHLINKYKVSEHMDFTLSTLEMDAYSEIIETPVIPMEQLMANLVEPWTCRLLTWVKKEGVINALPYWFKIKLFDNVSEVSTYSPTSFANQAAVLLSPHLEVKAGDAVCITFTCYQGLMNATVIKQTQ